MVNRAYYDEDNPAGDALFYVRRRKPNNNYGPSQEQVYALIQRTEGERGTRAGGDGPRLSPYRPLPGIGEEHSHLQPPPRPLLERERTYDVLKPRRRPPGAEASSLQVQDMDAEDNTLEEPRKPIKSILKKREQPGIQNPGDEHQTDWSRNDWRQAKGHYSKEESSLEYPSNSTKHKSTSQYHNPKSQYPSSYPPSYDSLSKNYSQQSLQRHHSHPDDFMNEPYASEKLWQATERPKKDPEKVEMEKQKSSQSARYRNPQIPRRNERRRTTSFHIPNGARGSSPSSSPSRGFTNRLRQNQGHFNPMELSRATIAFGPRMAAKTRETHPDDGSWFD